MSDDPFRQAYTDVEPWRTLWKYLECALQSLPETSWTPQFPKPEANQPPEIERTAIRNAILANANRNAPAIEQAIIQYSKEQHWPELAPEPAYFLRLIHGSVLDFVGRMGAKSGGVPNTIFPFPKASIENVAHWLLTDWWLHHGLRDYAKSQTSDEGIFFRYFA